MAFEIVAKRDSETVTMQRNSSLIAIAKARVWASEGWTVRIVVGDEVPPDTGEANLLALPAPDPDFAADLAS